MAYKQKSSGLPFKELGSSPAKQAVGGGAGEAIEHHRKYKAAKEAKSYTNPSQGVKKAISKKGSMNANTKMVRQKNLGATTTKLAKVSKKPTSTLGRVTTAFQNTPKQLAKGGKGIINSLTKPGADYGTSNLGTKNSLKSEVSRGTKQFVESAKGKMKGIKVPTASSKIVKAASTLGKVARVVGKTASVVAVPATLYDFHQMGQKGSGGRVGYTKNPSYQKGGEKFGDIGSTSQFVPKKGKHTSFWKDAKKNTKSIYSKKK